MKRSVSHMVLRMRHRCFGMLTCCNMAQRCKELHNSPRCNKMRISRLEGTSSRRPVYIMERRYPEDATANDKKAIRCKAARFTFREGELLYKKVIRGRRLQEGECNNCI